MTTATYLFAQDYEAPAMVKVNGVYFMFASHETGWDSNDNIYSTATSISGPWSSWKVGLSLNRGFDVGLNIIAFRKTFAPSGTNTFNSQTAFILQIGNNFLYLGGTWRFSLGRRKLTGCLF